MYKLHGRVFPINSIVPGFSEIVGFGIPLARFATVIVNVPIKL